MKEQHYPFGMKLKKVEQLDRTPKKVFILGVYASAVHAKWISNSGKTIVNALAVASEPYIFWRGENAEDIIKDISLPRELGKLLSADKRFNGPSGLALDEYFLKPLCLTRKESWLADLIPFTRLNPNQNNAIKTRYNPLMNQYNLPECSIPLFQKAELKEITRKEEILKELFDSGCEKIILLGDLPIKHFLSSFTNGKYKKLSDFGDTQDDYGKEHTISISNKNFVVLPLAHPRQVARLGKSSTKWFELHTNWVRNKLKYSG